MAYKTFANGFPLPASDLNNYLMNQSVIVFASAAERSSTLTSPTEGMITYLEDTDTVEVYNGSAWTDINDNTAAIPKSTVTAAGDLIVADGASSVTNLGVGANGSLLYSDGTNPSWLANSGTAGDVLQVNATGGLEFVTPSAGGVLEWTSIVSGSIPTGASSATFSSLGGYDNYLLIITAMRTGAGITPYLEINNTGFTGSKLRIDENSVSDTYFQFQSGGDISIGQTQSTGDNVYATMIVNGASSSSKKSINWQGGTDNTAGNREKFLGMGLANSTSPLTSMSVVCLGSTITAGTYQIWGA